MSQSIEQALQMEELGFIQRNNSAWRFEPERKGIARAFVWGPTEYDPFWVADVQPRWVSRDPRHPRFSDPVAAAVWIRVELGL